jgi:hypothetical protein
MTDTKLGQIMEECDRLGANERAKLLKHLLGDSSINVTIGSSHFDANTVYQINLAIPEQMIGILEAIADRISSKKT